MILTGCWLMLAVACLYHLAAWWLLRRFVGEEAGQPAPDGPWPPVLQIKPVRGLDPETANCLRSFVEQDYPGPLETVFVAEDAEDPGLRAACRLAAGRTGVRVEAWPQAAGANRKIACAACAARDSGDRVVVLSDADIRVGPDHLRRVVAPLREAGVGVATCLYAVRRARGMAATLEGLSVADFAASVLVARRMEGMAFALGATVALRPEALRSIGGLEAVRDYLADDYQLGFRAARAGWQVVLAGTVAEDVLGPMGPGDYLAHQLRWMRTYRVCRPVGHAAFLVTQGTLWALLGVVASGGSAAAWGGLVGWLVLRLATARANWELLAPHSEAPRRAWLVLLKDLVYPGLWLLSVGGSRVRWGKAVYRVEADGRMRQVSSEVNR